jgi:dihydrofolate reductase
MSNIVYIAQSADGYIADKDGNIEWLGSVPNPEESDFGWADFLSKIDAIVMGRTTYEKVLNFDCGWPYPLPVFILSSRENSIPLELKGKIEFISGTPKDITKMLNEKGFENLYIDGGFTIQSFLKEGLIDEMIITTIPILLGGGVPLFRDFKYQIQLKLKKSEVLINQLVKNHYIVIK